jgi:hypothetical protein
MNRFAFENRRLQGEKKIALSNSFLPKVLEGGNVRSFLRNGF